LEITKVKINGVDVEAPAGSTILEAARLVQIDIPTLCYLKDIHQSGACRICVVNVRGVKNLVASCVAPISPDMDIRTGTAEVVESRRRTLDLICSQHRMDCEYCVRYTDCELHALVRAYGLDGKKYSYIHEPDIDDSAVHMIMDKSKCVQCRRCVAICRKNQHVGVIGVLGRGFHTHVGTALPLAETACIDCGQCIAVCPTDALRERDHTRQVWMAINNPSKLVIAMVSPFVGAQLGECFLDPIGTRAEGKAVAALRHLGFDRIFDVEDAAAVTVMEESTELLGRLKNGGKLPMITSNCPSWIKFCESQYPELLENVSTSKSPQQMFGALCKSCLAEKTGIDPKDTFVVSIGPCTAEKFECNSASGSPNVDVSLTTRELAAMIRRACVSNYTSLKVWRELPEGICDPFPGIASGTGRIFSDHGGLMAATLGAAYQALTGKELASLTFTAIDRAKSIHEAEFDVNGSTVKVAAVSGLAHAVKLMDMVKSGEKHYTFIEVMACPGGCMNGGGQPHQPGFIHNFTDLNADRAKALSC
jgi:NADP-reducing hydrogenase subunit HndD